jgi:hypothetical protein
MLNAGEVWQNHREDRPGYLELATLLNLAVDDVYSAEITLAFQNMRTPLRRLRPRMAHVASDVPMWLLDSASRSPRLQRRVYRTKAHVVWMPVSIGDSPAAAADEGAALGAMTFCSDLLTGYSHDVRGGRRADAERIGEMPVIF